MDKMIPIMLLVDKMVLVVFMDMMALVVFMDKMVPF
jgi:hypothetical protein